MTQLTEMYRTPLFGIVLTVIFYVAAQLLNQSKRRLHPLFVTSGGLILFLLICGIPYEEYQVGGDVITFFLGPVTIALAVPLYKSMQKMKDEIRAIVVGVTIGSISGLASLAFLVWVFNGTRTTMARISSFIFCLYAAYRMRNIRSEGM